MNKKEAVDKIISLKSSNKISDRAVFIANNLPVETMSMLTDIEGKEDSILLLWKNGDRSVGISCTENDVRFIFRRNGKGVGGRIDRPMDEIAKIIDFLVKDMP